MQVEGELAAGLKALPPPDADVLAELLHQLLAPVFFGAARIARRRQLGERAGEVDELVVLGDEIGLGVELDERAELRVGGHPGADHAFGRDAARGLARLGAALDAQQLLGFLQVTGTFG